MTYHSDVDGPCAIAEKYEGEWIDGKMHGKGIYYYSDGSVYDGIRQPFIHRCIPLLL